MKRARQKFFASFLDKSNPEDEIFTEASVKMVADSRAMKKTKKMTTMIVAEIIYNGQRHEVWFSRLEIYELSYWTPTPFKALAGAIKKRLLNL